MLSPHKSPKLYSAESISEGPPTGQYRGSWNHKPRSRDHYQRKTHSRTRQIREVQSGIPPTGRRPSPQEREGRRNRRPAKARTVRNKSPNPTTQHQLCRQAHDEDSRSGGSTTSHNGSVSTSSGGPGSRNREAGGGNS